jgi:hypothetical protein
MASAENMIRRALLCAGMIAAASCERAKAPARTGHTTMSTSSSASSTSAVAAAPLKPWDDALGALLATPSLDGGTPVLFVRDTLSVAATDVELFNHDDRTTKATLRPGAAIRSCAWIRNASIATGDGRASPNSWSLALMPGIATPFGVDGVGELSPRDSAAAVARVSRLVSAIPEDSASSPFRGLPIVVRDAYRFQLADSTTILVAVAMRSLNVESNPRAQAVTLIAEPEASQGSGQWRTAYWESVSGPEDRVEGMDLLAAFQLHGAKPAVALVREGDGGLQVEIVERVSPSAWSVRWSTSSLPCANH